MYILAKKLVGDRLAACVNVVKEVHSFFWWQGEIESADENMLFVKTRATLLPALIESVKATHSYDVPEVIALSIIGGNRDYLNWLAEENDQR